MADMFPGAGAIGDSLADLFSGDSPAAKQQSAYYNLQTQVGRENRVFGLLDQGINRGVEQGGKANISNENSPQYGNEKNKPAATEDPMEVESRWTARLAKYAGIAQATGVKLGGV